MLEVVVLKINQRPFEAHDAAGIDEDRLACALARHDETILEERLNSVLI